MQKPNAKFLPDDFDRIYNKYFKALKENNTLKYDPSGWLNTVSKASEHYLFTEKFNGQPVTPYYSDYNDQLGSFKESICLLLNSWDNYKYSLEEFTLCSSVTLGSLVVLSVLAKKNIKKIFFETPAFYASINQAKSLGMEDYLIPTYLKNNYSLDFDCKEAAKDGPFILWLTQPRMSLGINQDSHFIQELYKQLPNNCYIVIDEASEQLFPSHLCDISLENYPRVIKIRNFFKGMGINGIRLSCIVHDRSFRQDMQRELESFQGAIDYFSLITTSNFGQEIEKFNMMLFIANEQTKSLRIMIQRKFESNFFLPSLLVNGYIGSLCLDLSKFPFPYRQNRENLLKYCFSKGVSIIVGATMKFAYDEQKEFIRLNYFKTSNEIEGALEIISDYVK